MRQRLADYVADFMVSRGITDVFSVVGGGAMHLNDAIGHHPELKVTYNHHEQASAIAAEAYARLENRIAAVCVTTGPGGTNAITGVLGGWLDSIPMFIVSGQVKYTTTARYVMRYTKGLRLRAVGDQEYDIVKSVEPMTKYAAMLEDVSKIRYMLEKAWHLATTGRPGPVWVDIPVDYQGTYIETEDLEGYDPEEDAALPPPVAEGVVAEVVQKLAMAERPVIYAGGGIRLSGSYGLFREVADRLGVPVVTYWNSVDVMEDEHPLYVGRGGNMGGRAGNFAVQNADFILALGTRISIRQTGYDFDTWARGAEVAMVDIDQAEMKKPTIHVDMPIWADLKDFLGKLLCIVSGEKETVCRKEWWREVCRRWKKEYPAVLPRHWEEKGGKVNIYAFIRHMSEQLPAGSLTAVSNGACCVAGHQAYCIKEGTRFIINNAVASMGYGLPAAVGLCIAGGRKETVCLEGDGSIMMNLQELQTVVTNRLPIKLFLINNQGYHSIRITQGNLFPEHCKVGIGPESGDLSFPEYEKVAEAFGFPYFAVHSHGEMEKVIAEVLATHGPVFCEVFTDTEQVWEPKSSTKRLADGRLVSPPLEDMAPFLPLEELERNMFIPLIS